MAVFFKLKAWLGSLFVLNKEYLEHCDPEDKPAKQNTSSLTSSSHRESENVIEENRAMEANGDGEQPVATMAAIRAAKESLKDHHEQAMKTALKAQAADLEKVHQLALEKAVEAEAEAAKKSNNVRRMREQGSQPCEEIKADRITLYAEQPLKVTESEEMSARQIWKAEKEMKKLRSHLRVKEDLRLSIAFRLWKIEVELEEARKGTSVHDDETEELNSELKTRTSVGGLLRDDEEVKRLEVELAESRAEVKALRNGPSSGDYDELVLENKMFREQSKSDNNLQRDQKGAIDDARVGKNRLAEFDLLQENKKLTTSKAVNDADAERQELKATVKSLRKDLEEAQMGKKAAAEHAAANSRGLELRLAKLSEDLKLAKSDRDTDAEADRLRIVKLEESGASLRSALEQFQDDKGSVSKTGTTPPLEPEEGSQGLEAARRNIGAVDQQDDLRSLELEEKVDALTRDLEKAREAEKQATENNSHLLATIEKLRKGPEVSEMLERPLKDVVEEGQDTITKLRKNIEGYQQTIQILERKNTTLTSNGATLEQKVQDLELRNEIFEDAAMLDIVDEPNSAAQSELDKLRRERSDLQAAFDQQVCTIQELTGRSQMLPTQHALEQQINLLIKEKDDLLFSIQQRENSYRQESQHLRAELEANYERGLKIQHEGFTAAINNNEDFSRFKRELNDHVMKEYNVNVQKLNEHYHAELEKAKEQFMAHERANLRKWAQQDQEKRHRKEMDESTEAWHAEKTSMRKANKKMQDLVQSLEETVDQLKTENEKLQQQDDGLHEGTRYLSEYNDELAARQRLKAQEATDERLRAERISEEAAAKEQDLEQRIGMEQGIATGQTESLRSTIQTCREKITELKSENTSLREALAGSKSDVPQGVHSDDQKHNPGRTEKRFLDQEEISETHRQKAQRTEQLNEDAPPRVKSLAPLVPVIPAVQSMAAPSAPLVFGSETPGLVSTWPQTPSVQGTQSNISQELSKVPNGFAELLQPLEAPANRWIGMTTQEVRTELNSFRRTILENKLKWSK
ncbi:MAG: hypothetical protein M1812_003956 [Candelaria pacifica]|nr:MAG: hypothetical protein M1812_003956 [Candelaria pacifica]